MVDGRDGVEASMAMTVAVGDVGVAAMVVIVVSG